MIQAYAGEEYVMKKNGVNGLVDLTRLNPIIYSLYNLYHSIGKPIGMCYEETANYKKQ